MGEEYLSIRQAAQIMGKSEQSVRDYCNEGRFPNATQPGGGKWAIPRSDVDAFMSGKTVAVANVVAEVPEAVKKAEENAQIAEAERKEALARKDAEAAKAGFNTAEEWDKAQKEFKEYEEKRKGELQLWEEDLRRVAEKNKVDTETNATLQKELHEQLKLANDKIQEQEQININAKKSVQANIDRILKHFKGGTIGIMEKAIYNLTTPIVTRAFVTYRCQDCHKDGSDKVNRVATFEIPRLKDCPPNFAFGVCADCDEDQRNIRHLPFYICDVCPVDKLMKESGQLVVEALATVGVKAQFDDDGQYRPTTYIDEKKRHLTKDEQVRLLIQGYGIGEENGETGKELNEDKETK